MHQVFAMMPYSHITYLRRFQKENPSPIINLIKVKAFILGRETSTRMYSPSHSYCLN